SLPMASFRAQCGGEVSGLIRRVRRRSRDVEQLGRPIPAALKVPAFREDTRSRRGRLAGPACPDARAGARAGRRRSVPLPRLRPLPPAEDAGWSDGGHRRVGRRPPARRTEAAARRAEPRGAAGAANRRRLLLGDDVRDPGRVRLAGLRLVELAVPLAVLVLALPIDADLRVTGLVEELAD